MASKHKPSGLDYKILYYIYNTGPVFTNKLAKRLNREIPEVREGIDRLRDQGYLERVTGSMIKWRVNKRNKVTKHRNHTYFDLTRKGRLLMRNSSEEPDINLRPPYKQA